jgi:hypothetical protein
MDQVEPLPLTCTTPNAPGACPRVELSATTSLPAVTTTVPVTVFPTISELAAVVVAGWGATSPSDVIAA